MVTVKGATGLPRRSGCTCRTTAYILECSLRPYPQFSAILLFDLFGSVASLWSDSPSERAPSSL
jgi:hypothetical protein